MLPIVSKLKISNSHIKNLSKMAQISMENTLNILSPDLYLVSTTRFWALQMIFLSRHPILSRPMRHPPQTVWKL
jgi:hypothetical protein